MATGVGFSTVTVCNSLFANAWSPIFVTPLGMVSEVRAQPLKARFSIVVTLLGMMMEVSLCQAKASLPMVVTLLGIDVFLQPIISVFELVSMIALQLLRLSYTELRLSTVIDARFVQPRNG